MSACENTLRKQEAQFLQNMGLFSMCFCPPPRCGDRTEFTSDYSLLLAVGIQLNV